MVNKRLKSSLNKMKKTVDKSVDHLDTLVGNPLKYISSKKSLKKSKSVKKSLKGGGMHHKTMKHGGKKHGSKKHGGGKYGGGKYGSKKHHMGGVKKMKTKKKTKGKSKYNVFMKKEIHKLKNMSQFKGKKHSMVFKAAAKNWSKNKKH